MNLKITYITSISLIIGTENEANAYCVRKRSIIPKVYSEKKLKHWSHHKEILFNFDLSDGQAEERDDETKQNIIDEVAAKMNALDNLFVDLTSEEVQDIQNILEGSNNEDEDCLEISKNLSAQIDPIISAERENLLTNGNVSAFGDKLEIDHNTHEYSQFPTPIIAKTEDMTEYEIDDCDMHNEPNYTGTKKIASIPGKRVEVISDIILVSPNYQPNSAPKTSEIKSGNIIVEDVNRNDHVSFDQLQHMPSKDNASACVIDNNVFDSKSRTYIALLTPDIEKNSAEDIDGIDHVTLVNQCQNISNKGNQYAYEDAPVILNSPNCLPIALMTSDNGITSGSSTFDQSQCTTNIINYIDAIDQNNSNTKDITSVWGKKWEKIDSDIISITPDYPPFPIPMTSKIENDSINTSDVDGNNVITFNQYEHAPVNDNNESDFGLDTATIFSPPTQTIPEHKCPNFYQLLDPELFRRISDGFPTYRGSCDESDSAIMPVTDDIHIQQMLEIMHLYFPGKCSFVSGFSVNFKKSYLFESFIIYRKMEHFISLIMMSV